jgi:hypothetical protein
MSTLEFDLDGFGHVVFSKPTRATYDRMVVEVKDEKKNSMSALRQFVCACAVAPKGTECLPMFDEWPGLLDDVSSKLIEMAAPDIEMVIVKGD